VGVTFVSEVTSKIDELVVVCVVSVVWIVWGLCVCVCTRLSIIDDR